MKQPAVHVLETYKRGTLHVGVMSDLVTRVWQHKGDFADGFTRRYGVHSLVWHERE